MQKKDKIRDFRHKGFFMMDDVYLNGYAKHLDPITTVVYLSLCRHADKQQIAYPAQELIAEQHNINPRTVRRKLKILQELNIIKYKRKRSKSGKWLHNTYVLLDKSEWKNLSTGHGSPVDNHRTRESETTGHGSPVHKETHKKETHTLSIANRKKSSIKSITEEDCKQIAEKYQVPLSFVMSKLDDLENYCERTGRRYKNYVAALRNFVKQDAIKLRKEQLSGASKRAIDASGL